MVLWRLPLTEKIENYQYISHLESQNDRKET